MDKALSKFRGWWQSIRKGSCPETSSPSSSSSSFHSCHEFNAEAAETHQSSSSSSSLSSTQYDVFLNSSGKDTRATFTSHLYHSLVRAGVQTFIDEEGLKKGEKITPSSLKAIAESRISISIFSTDYASSEYCLDELVKIMECWDKKRQVVLPIFYHVNPREVRKQTGSFGEQFHQLANSYDFEKVKAWKRALNQAGELKGWDLSNVDSGNESELIQTVIKNVWCELRETSFDVLEKPVGINSRVAKLLDLLNLESKDEDVKFVGIWGMGGIGKTTAAEAVFTQIRQRFEGSIFLEDIREASKQYKGLVYLQKQLLFAILKQKIQFITEREGKYFIKKCLHAKKVLIVLDDVDSIGQLEALAGQFDWFGPGSRIIITARNEHMLNGKVQEIYEVRELEFDHSFPLFCKHAFGKDIPPDDFWKLAEDVVLTAGGLPLALKVLGSFLFDKKSPEEWRDTLDRLKKIPDENVEEKLKLSFDGLDVLDKEIFLDIVCFFIGTDKEYATDVEKGCFFSVELGIKNLVQRSLIKIDRDNGLRVHDQLRDMGRHIVYKECPDEPGKRSRLWLQEDVVNVLKEQEGTSNVKGLILKFEEDETLSKEIRFRTKAFAAMSKLRLLQIDNAHLVGSFNKLPSALRWLSWKGCPLESIPTNFRLEKLVVLDLSYSSIKQVWKGSHQNQQFQDLKVLNLSRCLHLIKTPDFSRLPNLEKLNLEGCIRLGKLPESICNLKSLKTLILSGCSNLNELPDFIGSLEDLEVIKLDDCKLLSRSPDSIGTMRNLKTLSLDGTGITELPDTVGLLERIEVLSVKRCLNLVKLPDSMKKMRLLRELFIDETGIVKLPEDFATLSNLTELSMSDCREFRGFPDNFGSLVGLRDLCIKGNSKLTMLPISFSGLCSLESLVASSCNFSEGGIPSDFGKLSSLGYLDLSHNNFCSLPANLSGLSHLRNLDLNNCRNIQILPDMPSNLVILEVENCLSLESLSDLSDLKRVTVLKLSNCEKLAEIQGIEEMEALKDLRTSGCSIALVNCVKSFGQGLLQRLSFWNFPGSEIPACFTPLNLRYAPGLMGDAIRVYCYCEEVLARLRNPEQNQKIVGLFLCFVFTNLEAPESRFRIRVCIKRNGRITNEYIYTFDITPSKRHQDQTCLCHFQHKFHDFVSELEEGDEILFYIELVREIKVIKGGMHVVYEGTEQTTFKMIGDFITHSSHDIDGGEPSCRKRTKFQNDVDGGEPSSRKRTKLQ